MDQLYVYTDAEFQSSWGGQQNGGQRQGQPDRSSGFGAPQRYQSQLATNIYEFFHRHWREPCPLRKGYEEIKEIFKKFDDSNTKKWYQWDNPNEHFDEDIEQTIEVTRMFFDLKNPQFLANFHLLVYTTLRLEP